MKWHIPLTGWLIFGLSFNSATNAFAETAADPKIQYGTITFQLENDLFYGADRHYTNGLRLSWVSPPPKDMPRELNWLRERLKLIGLNNNDDTRLGLALAQEMYTPADRRRTDLILDDRPYAGWLYGAVSLHSKTDIRSNGFEEMLDSVEFDLGVVGRHSYAKETQDYIHDIRLFERFDGWHNQLKDEPGILLMYERKFRTGPHDAFPTNLQMDVVPHIGGSIGNVLTHLNLGGAARYGYNIPHNFGPPNLIKGMRTLDDGPLEDGWSLYAFAGAEGRYVAHNIFLDGNTWQDSHSVDREPWVADLSFGLAFEYRRFKIAYTEVLRTREFDGQDDNARFGSVSLSWRLLY
ncbi:MAG: lipid A deacylase LpxR family protein [Proteobacteria bacterium]|nr:lipid A deacylase LpxR family protein [Pseudomonadota bacterium]